MWLRTFFGLQRHEMSYRCIKHKTQKSWSLTQIILGITTCILPFSHKVLAKVPCPRNKPTFDNSWLIRCMTVVNILSSSSHQIKWDGRVNETDGLLRRPVRGKGWELRMYWWCFYKAFTTSTQDNGPVSHTALDEGTRWGCYSNSFSNLHPSSKNNSHLWRDVWKYDFSFEKLMTDLTPKTQTVSFSWVMLLSLFFGGFTVSNIMACFTGVGFHFCFSLSGRKSSSAFSWM